jgi:hypothetical protein
MKIHTLLALFSIVSISHGSMILASLDFDSLPSEQGFNYRATGVHAGVVETDAFSVTGTALLLDSIGTSSFGGGGILYERLYPANAFPDVQNYRLDLTARVDEIEGSFNLAFRQKISINGASFELGITPTRVGVAGGVLTFAADGFDGTIEHDYRVDVEIGPTRYVVELWVDDVLRHTSPAYPFGLVNNEISFGDGTGTDNSRGSISNFVVTTNIPEVSSLLFFVVAAIPLSWRRLHLRQ